jgi:type I restriction enzyme M protein
VSKIENIIKDFISGVEIKNTPEERAATQPFSKFLVEDYDYPIENIQTRPQYRVRERPSAEKNTYPVDIAIFKNSKKKDEDLEIIVECKQPDKKSGIKQLKDYLKFSDASIGIWFNGKEKYILHKTYSDGKVFYNELPAFPKYGERLEDIGNFKRKDLRPAKNLKTLFKTIRNYLAPNVVGATRDEVLAQQMINLIFCKIYDERFTKPEDTPKFRLGTNEEPKIVKDRILEIFDQVIKKFDDVIDKNDRINLDQNSLSFVVGEIQRFSLSESSRDAVADAFEVFIGPSLKGGQGQFFTPRNVIKMIIEIIDPNENDLVLDPACGSGGFLVETLKHQWNKIEHNGAQLKWPDSQIEAEKQKVAIKNIRGIDKDNFLSKVAKAYMALLGDGRSGVYCENSLGKFSDWQNKTKIEVQPEKFDVVIANPPFGSKMKISNKEILSQFEFGYTLKKDKSGILTRGALKKDEVPQILFIERCLNFLKEGGRLGIVLPDGIFGNDKMGYIRDYLIENGELQAVIDTPIETFAPHTTTKTSVLIFKKTKTPRKNYKVFMSIAKYCGHNKRGDLIDEDDLPLITQQYRKWAKK